jgi:hypothetical protein
MHYLRELFVQAGAAFRGQGRRELPRMRYDVWRMSVSVHEAVSSLKPLPIFCRFLGFPLAN